MPRSQTIPGIAGIGPVSPIGTGTDIFGAGLEEPVPAAHPWTRDEQTPVGEVIDLHLDELTDTKFHFLDRVSELALGAALLAVEDAVLDPLPENTGLCFASTWGCADTTARFHEQLDAKAARLAPPFVFTHSYANTPASLVSIECGLRGPHLVFSGADAELWAVLHALDTVASGKADAMLALGADGLSSARLAAGPETPFPGEAACGLLIAPASPGMVSVTDWQLDAHPVSEPAAADLTTNAGNCGSAGPLLSIAAACLHARQPGTHLSCPVQGDRALLDLRIES